jgi:pimeloyl-ACP methyl ester carboxylesterase
MAEWVLALLERCGWREAALVGHSMGAAIALETAARAPEMVSKLALLGIAAAMPVHPALLAAARDRPAEAYDMMTRWCFADVAKIGRNRAPGLWMTGSARALFDRNREGVLAADLTVCSAWTTGLDSARRVKAPTTLVLGARDVMTPAKSGGDLAAAIPAATTVTLESSGHMMMLEAPDATLDALIAHFGAGPEA